jgi:hypothetical protein
VFAGKPDEASKFELVIDDVIFFSNDPNRPAESEPFPRRVIFLAAFDTGPQEKYWPGDFDLAEKDLPPDSYWRVARAVPRNDDPRKRWIRLQIQPPRPVGDHTKLRLRYWQRGARGMTAQIFDATDQDNRHVNVKLLQESWNFLYVDFTRNSQRNDGSDTFFAAGHLVDDLFFFVEPEGDEEVELLIDEVVLYDAADDGSKEKRN